MLFYRPNSRREYEEAYKLMDCKVTSNRSHAMWDRDYSAIALEGYTRDLRIVNNNTGYMPTSWLREGYKEILYFDDLLEEMSKI